MRTECQKKKRKGMKKKRGGKGGEGEKEKEGDSGGIRGTWWSGGLQLLLSSSLAAS